MQDDTIKMLRIDKQDNNLIFLEKQIRYILNFTNKLSHARLKFYLEFALFKSLGKDLLSRR